MLFNTPEYLVFFAVVLAAYYSLRHRAQNVLLLAASYFFYANWDWRFLGLLLLSTLIDYRAGLAIQRARERGRPRTMKRVLALSVGSQLAILGFFKYFNFFITSADALLQGLGFASSARTLTIVLPVGISFYTFQTISYTVDIYRGQFLPTRHPVDFALSVAFFPHLVAGPIQRARSLIVQIERPRAVTSGWWARGIALFAVGLIRKVAIADPAGALADSYFADPSAYSTVPLACGLLLYGLQIYNDFAGYSQMARGSANLLGFELMRNFRQPYFASDISEFWRRWHISLSTWLRDYLYIPLGGNRKGRVRTYCNLFITMVLGGLWHGASWNFAVWGALHGVYLAIYHFWSERGIDAGRAPRAPFVRRALGTAAVFTLVTFSWLFFRAQDTATTIAYLRGLLAFTPGSEGAVVPVVALWMLTLAIDVPEELAGDEIFVLRWPFGARVAGACAACLLLLVSGHLRHEPFIYFQF